MEKRTLSMKAKSKKPIKYVSPIFPCQNKSPKTKPSRKVTTQYSQSPKHQTTLSKQKPTISSQILKNQIILKKIVTKIEKDVNKLVIENIMERSRRQTACISGQVSKKKHRKIKRVVTVENIKDDNKILSDTKSTRAYLTNHNSEAHTPKIIRNRKIVSIAQNQDFILLNGEFIGTEKTIVQSMKENFVKGNQRQIKTMLLHDQSQQSFQDFGLDRKSKAKAIKEYIHRKVQIIQKWWRELMKAKRQRMQRIRNSRKLLKKTTIEREQQPTINKPDSQRRQTFGQLFHSSEELLLSNSPYSQSQESIDSVKLTSPTSATAKKIVLTTESQKSQNDADSVCQEALNFRENAAKIRKQTHLAILKKLKLDRGFDDIVYRKYLETIDSNFQKETEQIQHIREVLKSNVSKVKEIINNVKKDVVSLQTNKSQERDKLINGIFGRKEQTQRIQSDNLQLESSLQVIVDQEDINFQNRNIFQFFNFDLELCPSAQKKFMELPEVVSADPTHQKKLAHQLISQRVSNQLSLGNNLNQSNSRKPFLTIDTSLSGISKVLSEFLSYYIEQHKEQFLHFINTPFGQNPKRRLAIMQGYQSIYEETDEDLYVYGIIDVINKEYFHQYQKVRIKNNRTHKEDNNQAESIVEEYQMTHNMAIFDALNQAFDQLRPYYQTNGQNYEWCITEKSLSFYFITEQAIQRAFYKAQTRVIKWVGSQCGLIVDIPHQQEVAILNHQFWHGQDKTVENILKCYQKCQNPLLTDFRRDKLQIMEKNDIKEDGRLWTCIQQELTLVNYTLSMFVLDTLFIECCDQITNIIKKV